MRLDNIKVYKTSKTQKMPEPNDSYQIYVVRHSLLSYTSKLLHISYKYPNEKSRRDENDWFNRPFSFAGESGYVRPLV